MISANPFLCRSFSHVWLGFFAVICLLGGAVSCRGVSKICQQYIGKYQQCLGQTYQQARKQHSSLGAEEQRRSLALLQSLQAKLQSPQWKQRKMESCLKNPPSRQRFACVSRTPCNALSRCASQPSSATPELHPQPQR